MTLVTVRRAGSFTLVAGERTSAVLSLLEHLDDSAPHGCGASPGPASESLH
jgi:hypothetical protein